MARYAVWQDAEGGVHITYFQTSDPVKQAEALAKLERDGVKPAGSPAHYDIPLPDADPTRLRIDGAQAVLTESLEQ